MSRHDKLCAAAERARDALGGAEEDALIVEWVRDHAVTAYDDFQEWIFEREYANADAARMDYEADQAQERAYGN